MIEYRNSVINDYMWWEVKNIQNDFEGYCKSLGFKLSKETVKEFQCSEGYFSYFETEAESGIIIWWKDQVDEGTAYRIPDGFSFDIETGTLSSDKDFTRFRIVNCG